MTERTISLIIVGIIIVVPILVWIEITIEERYASWKKIRKNPENIFWCDFRSVTKEMQEYVCQQRPDLIHKISCLHPDLIKKYKNELNISKIDI
jgi:ABC-type maltose transport system permease subunit